jgi:type II restriction enzyme
MDLAFTAGLADAYRSSRQRIRVLSEHWVSSQVFCPNCGNAKICQYGNNSQVADFYCSTCREDYELKSQRARFGGKVVDGGYPAMQRRLNGNTTPNLLLLNYDFSSLTVTNLLVIPKYFFTLQVIEERKPLPPTAKRAGWVGCRILLHAIPHVGRIDLIRNGAVEPKAHVLKQWKKTLFLRRQHDLIARGWLLQIMRCIERIGKSQFSLDEVYAFENELQAAYPDNHHIRAKIRQRLQVLRDNGYLEFTSKGIYKLVPRIIER